jgi:heme-degrading monooxygenase HmoA
VVSSSLCKLVVSFLVLARMSTWTFKNGKREEGFSELDMVLSTIARNTKGFRGSLSLISRDNSNSAVFLTLWNDEESLEASESGVFKEAIRKVEHHLQGPPKVDNYRVFSAELLQ